MIMVTVGALDRIGGLAGIPDPQTGVVTGNSNIDIKKKSLDDQ